jgi:hypothetical protein
MALPVCCRLQPQFWEKSPKKQPPQIGVIFDQMRRCVAGLRCSDFEVGRIDRGLDDHTVARLGEAANDRRHARHDAQLLRLVRRSSRSRRIAGRAAGSASLVSSYAEPQTMTGRSRTLRMRSVGPVQLRTSRYAPRLMSWHLSAARAIAARSCSDHPSRMSLPVRYGGAHAVLGKNSQNVTTLNLLISHPIQ